MRELIPVFDRSELPAINNLLKRKALPCPICFAPQAKLCFMSENRVITPRHVVFCTECRHMGAPAYALKLAVTLWNHPLGSWGGALSDFKKRLCSHFKRKWGVA